MTNPEGHAPTYSTGPLEAHDLTGLRAILEEHVRDADSNNILTKEVEDILSYMQGAADDTGRTRTYVVARNEQGQVIGCMAYAVPDETMCAEFSTSPEESAELLNAFVITSSFRGGGVGRKLFSAVCDAARANGKKFMVINSGPRYEASWAFYDRMTENIPGTETKMLIELYGKTPEGKSLDAKAWKIPL